MAALRDARALARRAGGRGRARHRRCAPDGGRGARPGAGRARRRRRWSRSSPTADGPARGRVLFPCAEGARTTIADGLGAQGLGGAARRGLPHGAAVRPRPGRCSSGWRAADALTLHRLLVGPGVPGAAHARRRAAHRCPGTWSASARRRPPRPGRRAWRACTRPGARRPTASWPSWSTTSAPGVAAARRLERHGRGRPLPFLTPHARAASPPAGCAGCAARRRCAGWWPRRASASTTWSPRSSCAEGIDGADPDRLHARPGPAHRRLAGRRGQAPGLARRPRPDPLRRPGERKDAAGQRRLRPRRHRPGGAARRARRASATSSS